MYVCTTQARYEYTVAHRSRDSCDVGILYSKDSRIYAKLLHCMLFLFECVVVGQWACLTSWDLGVQAGVVEGENVEEVKKQKAIKGLLNKITPEKFDKILQDIIDVGYETEQTESGLIDQVSCFAAHWRRPAHMNSAVLIPHGSCAIIHKPAFAQAHKYVPVRNTQFFYCVLTLFVLVLAQLLPEYHLVPNLVRLSPNCRYLTRL